MSPELLEQLRRGAPATQMPQQGKYVWQNGQFVDPTATTKKKGRGGFLSSIISEGSATGGAAAGAALGSIVPGVGTLIGAGIGGALGGFGGRLLENKVRDDRYGLSEALQEGVLSGALSAIPGGKSAATLARGGAKATGKKVATETVENVGKLGKLGSVMRANPRGITPGMPVRGGILSTEAALAQNKIIDKVSKGTKGITKSNQFTQLEKELDNTLKTYSTSKEAGKKFTDNEALDVLQRFEANILDNPSLSQGFKGQAAKTQQAIINDITKLSGKTRKDFIELVSGKINPRYKVSASGGNAGSIESQVYEAARDAMKGFIDESLPGRSEINKKISTIIGAQKNLSTTIGRDVSGGAAQGITLGRALSNVVSPALEVGGRVSQQAGRLTNSTLGRQTTRQVGGRAIVGTSPLSGTQAEQTPEQIQGQQQIVEGGAPNALYGSMAGQMGMGQAPQSAYSLQDAIADLQRATTASQQKQIMDRYDFVSKAEAAQAGSMGGGSGLNVTKPTSEKFAQAQGGMQALDMLESLIAQDPGVIGRTRVPGRGIGTLGIGSTIKNVSGTGEFDSLGFAAVDNMLRIATGAAAPEGEIRRYMAQYLPEAGDSPATIQTKLDTMRRQFNSILNLANVPQAQTNPLYDAIGNMGGTY